MGPEIVAPGADAMGLVHRQGHQPPRGVDLFEETAGGFHLEPFR